ncbi:thioredoxin family protein [Legionella micdadei]|uniref:Peroxiredoxin n=1 Tax=Legionella micdadei TaxID=451 RepID=A0A098GGZ7_LEGMI|nr:thioredoxin family protein [Legionella micdadei]ARG97663.1 thioredoxin family protein [Legionella micdadei]ARH00023.1 thioredoxin family protein [Legionella micdadei]KTD27752.1 putative thiol-disulfide isomerase [Legionella micdadei]NSL17737.1 thioredoxin family protein [Legionella micdadei]CEG60761.1 putative Thioredoxin-like protein [Legionella micdadei]
MAKTASNMLPLGTYAPHFSLLDVVSGKKVNLNESSKGKITVVMFICNHCPYVKHINKELTCLANDYIPKGVKFYAINSNNVESYPDDSPENMKKTASIEGYPFPYLFDETQEVAKAYQAACTPDFYVFDSNLKLSYRGQLDDSRPGNHIAVTGNSIRQALDCLLTNQPLDFEQKPSLGCNIKWKD